MNIYQWIKVFVSTKKMRKILDIVYIIYRKISDIIFFWIPYIFAKKNNCKIVYVSAADSSHFCSLIQFAGSLLARITNEKFIVYDLGLTDFERDFFYKNYPSIEVRIFDYSQYPEHCNIKHNAGEYAWKPVIISDIMDEFKCCVVWMDAGNYITSSLGFITFIINNSGFYSPISSGLVKDRTHPQMLSFLNVVDKNILEKRNLTGGCVAVNYHNSLARAMIHKRKEYALIKECIAPTGSNRSNHRQDQSLLTVLAYTMGLSKNMPMSIFGFKIHCDIDHNLVFNKKSLCSPSNSTAD